MAARPSSPNRGITKRVRLTPEEAEWLAEVAEDQGRTESDVIREGLELVTTMHRRRKYIHLLIEDAKLVPGPEDPNDKSWQVGGGGKS